MKSVVDRIGLPALLEQTAEECAELAHACLKEARRLPRAERRARIQQVEDSLTRRIITQSIFPAKQMNAGRDWRRNLEPHNKDTR